MQHLTEQQLVMMHYGDGAEPAAGEHLEECAACRLEYDIVRRVLSLVSEAPVPDGGANYEKLVWNRLRWRLGRTSSPLRLGWIAPLAAAAVLAVVFAAGVLWQHQGSVQRPSAASAQTVSAPRPTGFPTAAEPDHQPQRVLLLVVGDHLDRSERILLELVNADPKRPLDVGVERERSEELLASNRIYRQTAEQKGQTQVASVLDELEPVLMDLAHSPSRLQPAELRQIQKRIESRGLLFKVRVIGSELEKDAPTPRTNRT